jgi:transcriptional regulator with XRE-family HTH domain
MHNHPLENYLRMHRRRSGLTQREIGFLFGCKDGATLSRYERRKRLPSLRIAIACGAIFKIPVTELFPGVREEVDRDLASRIGRLGADLLTKSRGDDKHHRAHRQKLAWLAEHHGLVTSDA